MIVHNGIDQLPAFTKAVITTGTFDGVHSGHLQILKQLKTEAEAIGGEMVVITFNPHPRQVLSGQKVGLINTIEERIELMRRQGVNHLVIVPFTMAFAEMDATAYVRDFLVGKFHPSIIVTGFDHHFGKGRQGNYVLLEQLAENFSYEVKEIPQYVLQEASISSTKIRNSLLKGNIEDANRYCGYHWFFSATVIEGNKLGRTIGYPTANLHLEDADKLVPGNGVYAVMVDIGGLKYKGMMNIGVRPTVNGTHRVIEVNIFDFDKEIYGQTLTVNMYARLRDEQKFNGLEALKLQLAADKLAALQALSAF